MSSFYLSPNVEKVGKGLDILVKDVKVKDFYGGRSASQEPREYKVRIEHKSGAGGAGGKKRKNELSLDWIFTCSCCLRERPIPICKHIGACMLVHFH